MLPTKGAGRDCDVVSVAFRGQPDHDPVVPASVFSFVFVPAQKLPHSRIDVSVPWQAAAAQQPLVGGRLQQQRGIPSACARRMSFDRRRRSSASRRPSSPALVPNKSSSAIPNMNSLIEPTVFARAGTCSMPHPD
eukprot:988699-Rhodomonas_salina.1